LVLEGNKEFAAVAEVATAPFLVLVYLAVVAVVALIPMLITEEVIREMVAVMEEEVVILVMYLLLITVIGSVAAEQEAMPVTEAAAVGMLLGSLEIQNVADYLPILAAVVVVVAEELETALAIHVVLVAVLAFLAKATTVGHLVVVDLVVVMEVTEPAAELETAIMYMRPQVLFVSFGLDKYGNSQVLV
jgi:hypothetical protein